MHIHTTYHVLRVDDRTWLVVATRPRIDGSWTSIVVNAYPSQDSADRVRANMIAVHAQLHRSLEHVTPTSFAASVGLPE